MKRKLFIILGIFIFIIMPKNVYALTYKEALDEFNLHNSNALADVVEWIYDNTYGTYDKSTLQHQLMH